MSITSVQLFSIPVTDMDAPVRNQAWGSSAVVRDPGGNRLVIQTTTAV